MKTINIIGGGRVGKTLGKLWANSNQYEIQSVLSTQLETAKQAVKFIGQGSPCIEFLELKPANITLIATPDDAIESSCQNWLKTNIADKGDILFHCSGSKSSELLSDAKKQGCFIASAHPIHSFANPELSCQSFNNTHCTLEGDKEAIGLLAVAFKAIGANTIDIDRSAKTLYHAGLVFSCNYVVSILEVGLQIFEQAGIDRETALTFLNPILNNTIQNVTTLGTESALTGPIARGDVSTIRHHLAALENTNPAFNELYKKLGSETLTLGSKKQKLSNERESEIRKLFE